LKDYRIIFEKKGISRYISHLDLNRCMLRAVRRSGLPAWYTEGFHPHLYLMFPLALSLGTESICEVMDFRLTEERPDEEILLKLNASLPSGLRAVSVHAPDKQAQDIGSAEYLVTLSAPDVPELNALWNAFLSQEQILTEKRTKKGMKEIDIKSLIDCKEIIEENQILSLRLVLPAGNDGNINVSVVTDAFQKYADKPFSVKSVCRMKIFCRNGEIFF